MKTIIRLDDFGMTESINQGFKLLLNNFPICNVSIMVNTQNSREALEYVKDKENFAIGLHVNLSSGSPLSTGKSLTKENNFFYSSKEIKDMKKNYFNKFDIYDEILAQLSLFKKVAGRLPDYFDLHAINLPIVYEIMTTIGKEFNIPYIENPNNQSLIYHHSEFDQYSYYQNNNHYFFLDDISLSKDKINHFVFHPGFIDEDLISLSSLTNGRLYDMNLLFSNNFSNWINRNKLELLKLNRI